MTPRLKLKITALLTKIALAAVAVADAFARPAPELERVLRATKTRY